MSFQRRSVVTANEIRLKRSQHRGAFGVVEGPDDKLFYRRFIGYDNCNLVVAYGKENVLDVVRILEKEDFRGVFGLVDVDFDALDGCDVDCANIICGDTHDVEAMLVQSPALDHVLREYGSENKIELFCSRVGHSVRSVLIKAAKPLAYLRWYSQKHQLNLRFEGLRFSEFLNRENLEVNTTALFKAVKNNSLRHEISTESLETGILGLADPTHNEWHLCNGHDLVAILSYALRLTLGSERANRVRAEDLSTSLRLAYGELDFRSSAQHRKIRQWETLNPAYRVLA